MVVITSISIIIIINIIIIIIITISIIITIIITIIRDLRADVAMVALPPRLVAESVAFEPALGDELAQVSGGTPCLTLLV